MHMNAHTRPHIRTHTNTHILTFIHTHTHTYIGARHTHVYASNESVPQECTRIHTHINLIHVNLCVMFVCFCVCAYICVCSCVCVRLCGWVGGWVVVRVCGCLCGWVCRTCSCLYIKDDSWSSRAESVDRHWTVHMIF